VEAAMEGELEAVEEGACGGIKVAVATVAGEMVKDEWVEAVLEAAAWVEAAMAVEVLAGVVLEEEGKVVENQEAEAPQRSGQRCQ
jgi:hypothetical protein